MRVINYTDSTLNIEGIYIPAGQHRPVRSLDGLDELPERVQARLETGDIGIPDYEGAPEPEIEPDEEPRRFGGFFGREDNGE